MGLENSIEEQRLLADTFRRASTPMTARERLSELAAGGGFVLAVAILWHLRPPHAFAAWPVALCLVVLVACTQVRCDMATGFTVPTQLAFVPLLFVTPLALVGPAVVIALALGRIPPILAGRARLSRLPVVVANAWFALGPVAVLAIADKAAPAAGPLLLLAALLAQFAVDFANSCLRYCLGRGERFSTQLRETWVYAIDAGLSGMGLLVAEQVAHHPIAALAPVPVLGLLAAGTAERHRRLEHLLELNDAYRGTALVLGSVIDADDSDTGEHCKTVVELALKLGDAVGLPAARRRNLEFAALLHDVGKIAVPNEIINKRGALDAREWETMKTHTIEGQRLLDQVGGFMRTVGSIVRAHHERWDGTGYPDGLAGEAIPLEARMIAVCDAWHAMRSDRSYRRALPVSVALDQLITNAGSQFDPHLVQVFSRLFELGRPAPAEPAERPIVIGTRRRTAVAVRRVASARRK